MSLLLQLRLNEGFIKCIEAQSRHMRLYLQSPHEEAARQHGVQHSSLTSNWLKKWYGTEIEEAARAATAESLTLLSVPAEEPAAVLAT